MKPASVRASSTALKPNRHDQKIIVMISHRSHSQIRRMNTGQKSCLFLVSVFIRSFTDNLNIIIYYKNANKKTKGKSINLSDVNK